MLKKSETTSVVQPVEYLDYQYVSQDQINAEIELLKKLTGYEVTDE